MLRIGGGTHFLVLRRTPDHRGHTVAVIPKFDEAIRDWEAGSRISSILPTISLSERETVVPDLTDGKKRWLLFLGPLHPGRLVELKGEPEIFLTLGLFNVLAVCSKPTQVDELRALADSSSVRWEMWALTGSSVDACEYSALPAAATTGKVLSPVPDVDAIKPTSREYAVLLSSTLARARLYCPSAVSDLERFDQLFREVLAETTDPVAKHGHLVITNAALSRYSSQTFAGTTPIFETECHFWTHSLLGVGIASMALQKTRKFISNGIEKVDLIRRLQQLKEIPPCPGRLTSLATNDDFWAKDYLFSKDKPYTAPKGGTEPGDRALPLLTCFSGRDGFRSTQFSLSGPLEVITSCNTTSWTLQTLSHELSHVVIGGVLGALVPRPLEASSFKGLVEIATGKSVAKSLFEQVQATLAYAIWRLGQVEVVVGPSASISPTQVVDQITDQWQQVNEILTHLFDYMYFYRRDPEKYVESIWASWGVIPNIERRVEEYVFRSLCAVHVDNLRREGGAALTREQVQNALSKAREKFPNALYIGKAIDLLTANPERFEKRLKAATRLVQFAGTFLYSSQVELILGKETLAVGGTDTYAIPDLGLQNEPINNPLRFIDEMTDDKQSDHRRSLWMLIHLAFAAVE
jgi:hypothetical protein